MINRKYINGKIVGSAALLAVVAGAGVALASWKANSLEQAAAASSNQPEPMEAVVAAVAREREHSQTATSIGTVVALRSITLRTEVPGTVHRVALTPGQVVEAGAVLVALDVSVEEAELEALKAQSQLAATVLARMERMSESGAASRMELDNARAERDVALAQIARTRAIIARKTIRAPFRARVGISDVHEGQYLNEGTQLTTLQGVDEAAYVDFTVAQQVAANLRRGGQVSIFTSNDATPTVATIMALDARVDPSTRNTVVRAKLNGADQLVAPGASVRVVVPVGAPRKAVSIPASALRKGPGGDHVFVLEQDPSGQTRARERQVKVDTLLGDEVIVRDGLAVGERVAASGSFKLREAVLVAVTDAEPALASVGGEALATGSF